MYTGEDRWEGRQNWGYRLKAPYLLGGAIVDVAIGPKSPTRLTVIADGFGEFRLNSLEIISIECTGGAM
jgi:hypothetical protein